MKLTDIHNHVMFDIDDGAQSQNQSIMMLQKAYSNEVKEICMTPHFFLTDPEDISELQQKTRLLQKNFKDIKLHFGCEFMMENNIPEFIEKNPELCLGDGRYLLIELPMFNYPVYVKEILYNLKLKGFNPIIAHPERNVIIQKNPMKYLCEDILENGLIQVNAGSITGKYGKKIKKKALNLIKNNLVSFVASDSHKPEHYEKFKEAYEIVQKKIGTDIADELFQHNPHKILTGEIIPEIDISNIGINK